jgi:uncharacterized protein HemX
MPAWLQVVTTVGGLLGLGAGAFSPWFVRAQLRKFKAEGNVSEATAAETIQRSAAALLQPAVERAIQLDAQLKIANGQVFDLTLRLSTAQAEVADLRNQMDRMSKDLVAKTEELERIRREYRGPTG